VSFDLQLTDLGYDDLVCETGPTKREYVSPDGHRFPSVTTVLSILSEEHIAKWKERVGEAEAERVSRRASNRGTLVHEIIEMYIRNDPDWAHGYMPHIISSFQAVRSTLDNRIGKVYGLETPLYSEHLGLAGRVDCVAEFDGKLSIIDFKTANKKKRKEWIENYFIQETAYAIMWEERTGQPITQLVTIIAADPEECQVFVEHRDNWTKPLLDCISEYKKRNP